MPVVIVGADHGSEFEAAKTLQQILSPIVGENHQLTIVVGARCLGETTQDIDLLLLGSFGRGITFTGNCGEARGEKIRLVNLCLIVEVKDHSAQSVRFDSQHVKVTYGNNYWSDATDQVWNQKTSLRNFLKRHNQPEPWIEGLVWLRNYNGTIPSVAANVLGANPSLNDFTKVLEQVRPPRRNDTDFFIAFTRNDTINSIQSIISFFRPNVLPTKLDRRRLEVICKKLISDQKYVDRLGKQLLLFRGRGGSGKTIHLLRLAKDLYDEGNRVLLLTFNKALVADIRRLLVIMNIDNLGFEKGIHISTAHRYFFRMLFVWGLWKPLEHDDTIFPEDMYITKKSELLSLLAGESPESLLKESVVQNAPETFAWDYVLVDEGQDWPEDERDLLFKCFGPQNCIVADGVDQLIRKSSPCDWTYNLPATNRQTVPLRRAMRMKSNLCRFISAFAEESGGEWDQEINEEILGGAITIIEGSYTIEQHEVIFQMHQEHGNEPIDALFCVPPDSMMEAPVLSERLRTWGFAVWDGTSKDVRDTFPTTPKEHRVVRYESCRGLEGWTVVCIGLDRFYDHCQKNKKTGMSDNLFDTPESFARRQASAWALIPLTRAIDHLVIQLEGQGVVTDICRKLSMEFPEFINWRISNRQCG